MRIVFMGTPGFAVPSLKTLIESGYDIAAVVTAPDKPAGRGQQIMKSEVKMFAESQGIKILQPTNLKSEDFTKELKELSADLQIVIAFRMLPEAVWNMPPLGTYNLHASLLPDYRGAAPINWAIINGENERGVTTFKLKHEIDTGNILLQEKVKINEAMTAGELHDVLMEVGADVVLKSVKCIESGNIYLKEQEEKPVQKHAPKIFRENCKIDWDKSVEDIHNLIRGLSPYPAAWTEFKNGNEEILYLKIFKTKLIESKVKNDKNFLSFEGDKIYAVCNNGKIEILELQAPGKKRLSSSDFIKGYRLHAENLLL
ncbi:MAG: methionyl-tRNA formyltransferase [Bacteroidota bacterium]